jgi:hypothetical protein
MKRGFPCLAMALLLASSPRLPAQSAEELVAGLGLFGSARFITMRIDMGLTLKNGVKDRTLEVFIRQDDRRMSAMIHVIAPAFLSAMKFLTQRDADGQETSWLKTSQGVRRLSDANGSERVFDSDFRAEDFMAISARRFALAVLPDAVIDSVPCRTVEARPLSAGGYARKLVYIGATDGSLRGIDFLDAGGRIIRRYRLTATRVLEGGTYPLTAEMTDLREGTSTALKVDRIDLETALPDALFNKGSL